MIFVLSDTHVPERMKELPRKLVERIGPADLILHAGDFVVWEVFRQLRSLAAVHAVRGNMDEARLRRFLPETKVSAKRAMSWYSVTLTFLTTGRSVKR